MKGFDFYFPARMHVGAGRRKERGKLASGFGNKALFVFDPFLKDSRVCEELLNDLQKNDVKAETFCNFGVHGTAG